MGWKRRTAVVTVASGLAVAAVVSPAAAEPAASDQTTISFTNVDGVELTCTVRGSSSVLSENRDGFLVILMTFETDVVDEPGCAAATARTSATLAYRRSDSGELDSSSASSSGPDASGTVQVNGAGI